MTAPLILTLSLHPEDQVRFDALRRRHFPAEHNLIPAHLTLFHHLPGADRAAIDADIALATDHQTRLMVEVNGLRSLGRGVAFTLSSPGLLALRAGFARYWHHHLTPQDRQGWRPHITIQNKVTPAEAASLLATMQAAFTPFAIRAAGFDLWHYVGGPWAIASRYRFPS